MTKINLTVSTDDGQPPSDDIIAELIHRLHRPSSLMAPIITARRWDESGEIGIVLHISK